MENQLIKIVEESGLEKSKAQVLLERFQNYFEIAAEWEQKAKILVVTNEEQTAEMKMAREGRLFLKQKRVLVENTRKELKEQSLREGQTIDSIARILKNLIEPIEEHLEKQEKFIEIRDAKMKAQRKESRIKTLDGLQFDWQFTDLTNMPDDQFDTLVLRLENERDAKIAAEKKAEEERIAKEKAARIHHERKEQILLYWEYVPLDKRNMDFSTLTESEWKERYDWCVMEKKKDDEQKELQRAENEKLLKKLKEQDENLHKEAEERAKVEAEKAKLEAEIEAKKQAEEKARQEAEAKSIAEQKAKEVAEKRAALAPDREKLIAFAVMLSEIQRPVVKSTEAKIILLEAFESLQELSEKIIQQAGEL